MAILPQKVRIARLGHLSPRWTVSRRARGESPPVPPAGATTPPDPDLRPGQGVLRRRRRFPRQSTSAVHGWTGTSAQHQSPTETRRLNERKKNSAQIGRRRASRHHGGLADCSAAN